MDKNAARLARRQCFRKSGMSLAPNPGLNARACIVPSIGCARPFPFMLDVKEECNQNTGLAGKLREDPILRY
jgi:hypothetical protein